MRLLAVTDDTFLVHTLRLMFRDSIVDTEDEHSDLLPLVRSVDYDAILIGEDGALSVVRQLKQGAIHTPAICLLDTPDLALKLQCFAVGADEVLSRSMDRREVVARVEAVVRRGRQVMTPVIEIGRLQVDLIVRMASVDGVPINLTGTEWKMLQALVLARSRGPISSGVLLDMLYDGAGPQPEIKIIDVFICKLRKKLAAAGLGKDYIETTWGRGYRIVAPEETAA